ncbi:MAG: hypothetical protein DRO36_02695 [Candidatus Hecatellales archaeon]|nr:MAG: hypothetical protein DRO36_02695 [Candidatus Hecatellales archaeon]
MSKSLTQYNLTLNAITPNMLPFRQLYLKIIADNRRMMCAVDYLVVHLFLKLSKIFSSGN